MVWPANIRYREATRKGGKTFEHIGDYMVPTAFVMEVNGHEGAPDAAIRFEVRDGRPECVEIRITAHDDGRAIRSSDMRVFNIDDLVESVFTDNARMVYPDEQTGTRWRTPSGEQEHWAARSAVATRRAEPARRTDELAEVAKIYRENIDGAPLDMVRTLMGYGSDRTAARRVKAAREAGYLPPTTQGKRQA